jgi:sorting nexin-8
MAPKPSTAALDKSGSQPASRSVGEPSIPTTPSRPGAQREDTLKFPESDPWSSPALHRGHNHAERADPASRPNEPSVRRASASDQRPLSQDGSAARPGTGDAEGRPYDAPRRNPTGRRNSEGWNSFDGSTINAFSNQPEPGLGPEASGGLSSRHDVGSSLARHANTGGPIGNGAEESVTVSLISEKEGMFMFQYRNYQVATARRGAKVVRRYSDFVWLLSCLHKRYPFRQLPLLPPKRVAGK